MQTTNLNIRKLKAVNFDDLGRIINQPDALEQKRGVLRKVEFNKKLKVYA